MLSLYSNFYITQHLELLLISFHKLLTPPNAITTLFPLYFHIMQNWPQTIFLDPRLHPHSHSESSPLRWRLPTDPVLLGGAYILENFQNFSAPVKSQHFSVFTSLQISINSHTISLIIIRVRSLNTSINIFQCNSTFNYSSDIQTPKFQP